MKKRLVSVLTVLALCLSLLPAAALAAGEHNDHNGWKPLNGTLDTISLESGNSYYLSDDVAYTGTQPINVTGTVTLCLNGHVLGLGGQYIKVGADAKFTLCDCTGGTTYGNIGSGGLWEKSDTSGNCNLTGGVLTGGKGYQIGPTVYGGGVYVSTRGDFNMTGGNIAGNSAQCGGGVYVTIDGTFTMSGGAITGNQASSSSSGGGGVYVGGGTFTMSGGAITGNRANGNGGGVFVDGPLNLFGNPVIQDNTVAGSANNLYLVVWKTISITGPLGDNTRIGVSVGRDHSRTLTNGWSTYMSGKKPADYFFSDNADYGVALDSSEAVLKEWEYTVVFDPNGGTGERVNQGFFAGETKALTANTFTRTGYTFTGWNTKADGTGSNYRNGLAFTPAGNVTLYAQWRANEYTVTFDRNGGTGSMDNQSFTYGETKALTANAFTKEGCTFNGWSTTEGGTVSYRDKAEVKNLTAEQNGTVTLYAVWSTTRYTISYQDVEGVTNVGELPTTHTYGTNTVIPDPTRTGYTFAGWKINGGNDVYTSLTLEGEDYTGDITLTATWTAHTYTVAFDANGGDGNPMGAQTFTYGEAKNLPANTFTKEGYTFAGWKLGNTIYKDEAQVENLTDVDKATVTLTAQWTANKYTVKFDPNGGDGTMADQTFTYDQEQALTSNAFTRTGYTFVGWNTEATGNIVYTDGQSVKNLTAQNGGTVILYAQWRANSYTITYNLEGGTVSGNPTSYTVESETITLNNPTRTGYTFAGWTGTDLSEASITVTIAKGSTGNRIYTATWTAHTYTVTFNPNGGTGGMDDQSFTYDQTQALTANTFTRAGYTFAGWNTKADGSGTTYGDGAEVKNLTAENNGEVTLYAQWAAHTYTVTFDLNGGDGGSMGDQTFTYDETQALTGNTFTRTGYTFAGWNTAADGTGTPYEEGQEVENLTAENNGEVTLYAQWAANTYTVKFNPNGGSGTMADQSFTYDQEQALASNRFTRTWYTFTGWNTQANGAGISYGNRATVVNLAERGTVTLYAQWKFTPPFIGHSITAVTDGNGTVTLNPTAADAGETVTITAVPEEGYEVGTITVTSVLGDSVPVTGNTFTMPAASVTVEVTFVKADRVNPFTDVAEDSWYYDMVAYATDNGLMIGTSATTFDPNSPMSRAMVWTVIARLAGQTIGGESWAKDARAWAMAAGVSDGSNPDGSISREEIVTMLYRYAGSPAVGVSELGLLGQYPDGANVSDWAQNAMAWAVSVGIINGRDGRLAAGASLTRAEAAAILGRFHLMNK